MVDHDGPVARLRVENSSDQLLELVVEPEGNDHWLLPGETFVVTTVGSRDADPWAGNTIDHEPFEVQYYSRSVTVHADGRWDQRMKGCPSLAGRVVAVWTTKSSSSGVK